MKVVLLVYVSDKAGEWSFITWSKPFYFTMPLPEKGDTINVSDFEDLWLYENEKERLELLNKVQSPYNHKNYDYKNQILELYFGF